MTTQADSPVAQKVNPYDLLSPERVNPYELLSPEREEELRLWGEAVELAQEAWAERCNEYRLSGSDDVPSRVKITAPEWYEEWFATHFRSSNPLPKWDEGDCPF
jgi:hypothetical protein